MKRMIKALMASLILTSCAVRAIELNPKTVKKVYFASAHIRGDNIKDAARTSGNITVLVVRFTNKEEILVVASNSLPGAKPFSAHTRATINYTGESQIVEVPNAQEVFEYVRAFYFDHYAPKTDEKGFEVTLAVHAPTEDYVWLVEQFGTTQLL
jgi:hypothetical protein